jgi:serine/threonine protein kinase
MHRNLKPDNILVSDEGRVVISDFTSSRATSANATGRNTIEEPNELQRSLRESKRMWYKSPEMLLRTQEYGKECDIWQIGCLFIEIVLCKAIFKSNSEIENLINIFKFTGSPN